MGFEDIRKPEQNQEKMRLQQNIQALIMQGVPLESVAELLGAEQFLVKERGKRRSGIAVRLNVEDFVRWVVDSAQHQNYQLQLPDQMVSLEETILPPDAGEIRTGSGAGFERAGYVPRTRYLIDLLTEMKLRYAVVDGTNTPEMMRQLSYKAFLLPQLGKLVLVCDEEENATYVVNNVRGEKNWQQYINRRKSELRNLIDQGGVAVVSYQGDGEVWKQQVAGWLTAETATPTELPEVGGASESLPPQGWLSALAIGKRLGKTDNWVKNRFADFPTETGKYGGRFYGSEQFYLNLKQEAERFPEKDPQLLSGSEIVRLAETTWQIWKPWIADYLREHPSVKPVFQLKPNGNPVPHYPPEVVIQFKDYVETRKNNVAPEGWVTMRELAQYLGCSASYVEPRVESLLERHPGQAQELYHGTRNTKRTFYSPFVKEELKKIIQNEREIPQNFISIEQLMKQEALTYAQITMRLRGLLKRDSSLEFEIKRSYEKGRLFVSPKLAQRILTYLEG